MIEIFVISYAMSGLMVALSVLTTLPKGRLADVQEWVLACFMFCFGPLLLMFAAAAMVTLLALSTISSVVNTMVNGSAND